MPQDLAHPSCSCSFYASLVCLLDAGPESRLDLRSFSLAARMCSGQLLYLTLMRRRMTWTLLALSFPTDQSFSLDSAHVLTVFCTLQFWQKWPHKVRYPRSLPYVSLSLCMRKFCNSCQPWAWGWQCWWWAYDHQVPTRNVRQNWTCTLQFLSFFPNPTFPFNHSSFRTQRDTKTCPNYPI